MSNANDGIRKAAKEDAVQINKLAQELHEAAVAKGFWDVEDAEIKHIAKMHSELSEAIQEDRCGRPMLYVDDIEVKDRITDPAMFNGRKPEGVAAELADFVMMTLDLCVQVKPDPAKILDAINYDEYRSALYMNTKSMSLPGFVVMLHGAINDLMYSGGIKEMGGALLVMVYGVRLWLEIHSCNLWEIIRLKMEYNRSRPKLHGRLY